MDRERRKIRLSSCIKTIVEVHAQLDPRQRDSVLYRKFLKLQAALESGDLDDISETDVLEIEKTTNRLLQELGLFYSEAIQRLDNLGYTH